MRNYKLKRKGKNPVDWEKFIKEAKVRSGLQCYRRRRRRRRRTKRRRRDRPWGPPILFCREYRLSSPEAWRWKPNPFSAEVKERVELYLYTTSGPSSLFWVEICLSYSSMTMSSNCMICGSNIPYTFNLSEWSIYTPFASPPLV